MHLELGVPGLKSTQDRLGYYSGQGCWALFQQLRLFPNLESLSIPLPTGNANFSLHCSRLIPKGVMRLSLSGHVLADSSIHPIFKVVSTHPQEAHNMNLSVHLQVKIQEKPPRWPANLCLVCIHMNPNYMYPYLTLVRALANCIPTV